MTTQPSRWQRLRPDLSPWRSSRDFRLLWSSGCVSAFGSFLTYVAVPLQIKDLTDSSFAVGLVGAVELVPLIVFGLWGGALADALDRRKLVLWSEAGLLLLSGLLLLNALLPTPVLWPVYLVAGLVAALDGLQRPALDSLTPRIVPHDQLTAAFALTSLYRNAASVAGPALAGVIVAVAGVQTAYALDVLTFGVSLLLLARMRAVPPSTGAEKPSLSAIVTGIKYAWGRRDLLNTYVIDTVAMLFAYPVAIYAFWASDLRADWALGLMYGATAAGALVVSATSGWTSGIHRHGRMLVLAALGWGISIALAGLVGNIWLVLFCLAVAGGADQISGVARTTIWNQSIPDHLRGRLAGVELLSYSVGPQLGQVRAGGMAGLVGVRGSVWMGGLACVVGVLGLAAAVPRLLRYDDRTDENVALVRAQHEAEAATREAAVAA
ncbi:MULTISPECIES: MFS transporter [unclassified Kitasatospora]|uniref:MFS transporter n=1 Tax=unclassified Kitasatospora TaxID=2633591 RepID=UPI000708EFDA|nr:MULTISPECIES: MFS transporter [unclassified Kitasatospora]KQV05735.1 MFS transporter [Kitasatospora sp. Root107]KRB62539.1 MFS transporter [Kitasatospora sp. Root187]